MRPLESILIQKSDSTIVQLIGVVGLLLNELFIWFFTERARFHYLASKGFSTALVYLWNFSARKIALFR